MRKYFLIIGAICFLLFGCKETHWEHYNIDFYFSDPQPVHDSELSVIPRKFRGSYALGDSVMTIMDHAIISNYYFKSVQHKSMLSDSIEGILSYKDGKLTMGNRIFDVKEKNDSLYLSTNYIDTLFSFSSNQKAKHFRGELILSRKDSIFWKINIISVSKDSLKWRHLSSKEDYVALSLLVKDIAVNNDTTVVRLNPTRREFNKILSVKNLNFNFRYKKLE